MEPLTRSQLAAAVGCHAEAIRHFERVGLLPLPPRSTGGHRRYGAAHRRRLELILAARNLGMTVEDLSRLLAALDARNPSAARVEAATVRVARLVGRRLADLDLLMTAVGRLNGQDDPA